MTATAVLPGRTPVLSQEPVSSQEPAPDVRRPGWPPRVSPRMLLSLLPTVLVNVVAPAVAYGQIRPHVASNAIALLAAMAIPVAYTLVMVAWRRRADALALLSVAGFGIALAATYFTGGSALAVELQDPAETGALGLACLVSVIAGRPLWLLVLRLLARRNAQAARILADPAIRRTATVETVIIGAIFLVHAIAITILALTVAPGTFLALSRPVGLPLLGAGVAVLIWYRRCTRARRRRDGQPS
jgi:hypothetical protein